MRKPIQCQGVERGPAKTAQIGVAGSVQPAFLGALAGIALPAIIGAMKGAIGA